MQAENLHQWFMDATRYETHDATNSQKVAAIVQEEFCDEALAEDSTWQKVFLIPKGASGDFREIGMVKVICKSVTILLNWRLTTAIKFNDVLHRFWEGGGIGNDALKNNLLQ